MKMAYSNVKITLEIGHEASVRNKRTQEGFTHDWEVFVRGPDGADIYHFIDKVVFHLHETFPKPKRTVKEPPYSVKESGYAGFTLPIDVYLKNNNEPRKIKFTYDLNLQPGGPPIKNVTKEKYVFSNPTEDFRRKLIRGGGVGVLGSEVPTGSLGSDKDPPSSAAGSSSSKSSLPAPSSSKKLPSESSTSSSSSTVKKSKPKESVRLDDMRDNSFHALFGTPIKKTNTPGPSQTGASKPPGPKSLTEKKISTGVPTGDKHSSSSSGPSSIDKPTKPSSSSHASPHKNKDKDAAAPVTSSSVNNTNASGKKDKKDKERDKEKEKATASSSKEKAEKEKPTAVIKTSSSASKEKVDKAANKEKERKESKTKESASEKKKDKKERKEKSHKHKDKDRERDKEEKEKREHKESAGSSAKAVVSRVPATTSQQLISTPPVPAPPVVEKSPSKAAKDKEASSSAHHGKHKHKKKDKHHGDKTSGKEKETRREGRAGPASSKRSPRTPSLSPAPPPIPIPSINLQKSPLPASGTKKPLYSLMENIVKSEAESDLSDADIPPLPPLLKKLTSPLSSLSRSPSPSLSVSPAPSPVLKKETKKEKEPVVSAGGKKAKKMTKESVEKKKKRKLRDASDSEDSDGAASGKHKRPKLPKGGESEKSPPSGRNNRRSRSTSRSLSRSLSRSPSRSTRSRSPLHSSPVPAPLSPPSSPMEEDSSQPPPGAEGTGSSRQFSLDYIDQLKSLQQQIMTLEDNNELQRIVKIIADTGRYEITKKTFDFDLCSLDLSTIKLLQQVFPSAS